MGLIPPLPPITVRGKKYFGKIVFVFLFFLSIVVGVLTGLLFVYKSDLPEIDALETYRPGVITELYADDGQVIGTFALQRRVIVTYQQIPPILRNAILATEDKNFFSHWGIDVPRLIRAAIKDLIKLRRAEGASTITMQLTRVLFLTPEKSFKRKIQEMLLAVQIERAFSKQQIFTMYVNQIYLGHGNYGFAAAADFYFGKQLSELTVPEAATLVARIRGPGYSPLLYPERSLARRNLVIERMRVEGFLTKAEAQETKQAPLGLHVQYPQNDLAPYFVEEIRRYLERTYGTEAVHEKGLRVYTTLSVALQKAANQAVVSGLLAYERRHGWRGAPHNILKENLGTLESYVDDDWRVPIEKGKLVNGLVMSVSSSAVTVKLGPYTATVTSPDLAWTGKKTPREIFAVGDLDLFRIVDVSGKTARVQLEQKPAVQGALVAMENQTGEIKAMVGGYSFEESKFNRATQALRQAGSSFKPYVYATAFEQGLTPFETVVDAPISFPSPQGIWTPHNYDHKFEGTITYRRALAESRNVPAIKVAEQAGIKNVVEMAHRFGISSRIDSVLPVAIGAADITLLEHTSAYTTFPNDGVRVDPYHIRKVTTYDGTTLEEHKPSVHDVIAPTVARTMVAALLDVVNFGTAVRAKSLGRPLAGKTGTTNEWSDAWFVGFSPTLTCGVWVGFDDKRVSLGKGETGARAALPIWMDFMKVDFIGQPVETFPNVIALADWPQAKTVKVDTPDEAPATHEEEEEKPPAPAVPVSTPAGRAGAQPGA